MDGREGSARGEWINLIRRCIPTQLDWILINRLQNRSEGRKIKNRKKNWRKKESRRKTGREG